MANTPNTMKRGDDRPGGTAFTGQSSHGEASSVADKAREAAASVADKTRETASAMADKAGEMASNVGHKAEDATAAVGGSMKSLAGSIREHAPDSGMLHSASTSVADTLESGGRYLQEHGLEGLGADLTSLVRRNPLPALIFGITFGFLMGRAARR